MKNLHAEDVKKLAQKAEDLKELNDRIKTLTADEKGMKKQLAKQVVDSTDAKKIARKKHSEQVNELEAEKAALEKTLSETLRMKEGEIEQQKATLERCSAELKAAKEITQTLVPMSIEERQ